MNPTAHSVRDSDGPQMGALRPGEMAFRAAAAEEDGRSAGWRDVNVRQRFSSARSSARRCQADHCIETGSEPLR